MAPFNSPKNGMRRRVKRKCIPNRFTFSIEDIYRSDLHPNSTQLIPHWTEFPRSKVQLSSRLELCIRIYRKYYYIKWMSRFS